MEPRIEQMNKDKFQSVFAKNFKGLYNIIEGEHEQKKRHTNRKDWIDKNT